MIYQENNQCFALSIPPRIEIRGILETVMRQDVRRFFTLFYHDIFDYPLTEEEVKFWAPGKRLKDSIVKVGRIEKKKAFFFLKGREMAIKEREKKEKLSAIKIEKAKKGTNVISLIPTVRMIGLTGALAMNNAQAASDVDLLIITRKGTLWVTRLATVAILGLFGIPRNSGGKVERDKLCLNMWLDESDLVWNREDRNFYTAHEIAQIVPLVNKENTYERFIYLNRWIKDFWPNIVEIRNPKSDCKAGYSYRNKFKKIKYLKAVSDFVLGASNFLAFKIQYLYMKPKITREIVTPTRAIFHPRDWSKIVSERLTT